MLLLRKRQAGKQTDRLRVQPPSGRLAAASRALAGTIYIWPCIVMLLFLTCGTHAGCPTHAPLAVPLLPMLCQLGPLRGGGRG